MCLCTCMYVCVCMPLCMCVCVWSTHCHMTLYVPSSSVLGMVGTSQQDIALQTAQYEICVSNDIIAQINTMLEVSVCVCVCV